MTIINKVVWSRKKTQEKVRNILQYTIKGDKKDHDFEDRVANGEALQDKLIAVQSSYPLEQFDHSLIDNKEYLDEYYKAVSDDIEDLTLDRSNGKKENRFSHYIVSFSADEYGKHTPEKLFEIAKDSFMSFYELSEEDFIANMVLHETEKDGAKMNDIHVVGNIRKQNGKYKFYNKNAKAGSPNNLHTGLDRARRFAEKKHNLTPFVYDMFKKNGYKEVQSYENTGVMPDKMYIKEILHKVAFMSVDFDTKFELLKEAGIAIHTNLKNDNSVNGVSITTGENTFKLSSFINNNFSYSISDYEEEKKLTSANFYKDFLGYDETNGEHIEAIEYMNLASDIKHDNNIVKNKAVRNAERLKNFEEIMQNDQTISNAGIMKTLAKKEGSEELYEYYEKVETNAIERKKKQAEKATPNVETSRFFTKEFEWMHSVFNVENLGEKFEVKFKNTNYEPIIDTGNAIQFKGETDFVVKAGLLASIEKFNKAKEGEPYIVNIEPKGNKKFKEALYYELELLRLEDPVLYKNVNINFVPKKERKIDYDMEQRAIEFIRKAIEEDKYKPQSVIDLSELTPAQARASYRAFEKIRATDPLATAKTIVVGYEPTQDDKNIFIQYSGKIEMRKRHQFKKEFLKVRKIDETDDPNDYQKPMQKYIERKVEEWKQEQSEKLDDAKFKREFDKNGNVNFYGDLRKNQEYQNYLNAYENQKMKNGEMLEKPLSPDEFLLILEENDRRRREYINEQEARRMKIEQERLRKIQEEEERNRRRNAIKFNL